ncbi:GNAT family N-acetyltransferase [Streptomyces lomondensis]|nr:GNAT family N-acetyltransferase [Streptomyces lomondensis]
MEPRSESASQQWIDRMRHYLRVDPGGCWVAVGEDGDVVGFAMSQNRGGVWYLATYGVVTRCRGLGVGRRLMDASPAHADGRPGLFSSTVHPGATRRYRMAGFTLHPQMRMVGTVDRSTLPAVQGLREGRADDFAWMDRLDERVRGAGHGPDHAYMLERLRLVVSDDLRRGHFL